MGRKWVIEVVTHSESEESVRKSRERASAAVSENQVLQRPREGEYGLIKFTLTSEVAWERRITGRGRVAGQGIGEVVDVKNIVVISNAELEGFWEVVEELRLRRCMLPVQVAHFEGGIPLEAVIHSK